MSLSVNINCYFSCLCTAKKTHFHKSQKHPFKKKRLFAFLASWDSQETLSTDTQIEKDWPTHTCRSQGKYYQKCPMSKWLDTVRMHTKARTFLVDLPVLKVPWKVKGSRAKVQAYCHNVPPTCNIHLIYMYSMQKLRTKNLEGNLHDNFEVFLSSNFWCHFIIHIDHTSTFCLKVFNKKITQPKPNTGNFRRFRWVFIIIISLLHATFIWQNRVTC